MANFEKSIIVFKLNCTLYRNDVNNFHYKFPGYSMRRAHDKVGEMFEVI